MPSRYLVADAGVIRSQVVTVSRRDGLERKRWVHLDVGFFSGLPEVVDEAIRYRIVADGPPGRPSGPVAIAGPTCDSLDILYESTPYLLPLDLASEDHVHLLSTGAYTATLRLAGLQRVRTDVDGGPPAVGPNGVGTGMREEPSMSPELWSAVVAVGQRRVYPAGSLVFAEGDPFRAGAGDPRWVGRADRG